MVLVENRLVAAKRESVGEGWIGSLRLADRFKLVYTEMISKVLLYSTGNYIQYSVINHNGKKNVDTCITESLLLYRGNNTVIQLYFNKNTKLNLKLKK